MIYIYLLYCEAYGTYRRAPIYKTILEIGLLDKQLVYWLLEDK